MSKLITEDDSVEISKIENLSFKHNHDGTIYLYDDENPSGNITVGRFEIWEDAEMDKREYIIINYEIVYLDTLEESY